MFYVKVLAIILAVLGFQMLRLRRLAWAPILAGLLGGLLAAYLTGTGTAAYIAAAIGTFLLSNAVRYVIKESRRGK